MPRTTRDQEIEKRKTIVEWIIAITTIFWSVWWGFYMQEILEVQSDIYIPVSFIDPPLFLVISANFLLSSNVIVVSIFTLTFVRWLWSVHKTAYRHFLIRSLVRASAPLCFSILILIANIGLIGNSLNVSSSIMEYGIILTSVWPIIVLFAIWK